MNARLTLDEGETPLEKVKLDESALLIKREDKNPNNSFKDRSLAYQISTYKQRKANKFVISSSGNSAVSAAAYCKEAGFELDIFVSESITPQKLEKINKFSSKKINIHKSLKAKSDAIKFARENNAINLRGSMDDEAIIGFKTIAYELYEENPDIDAIFIPCSSGTSTKGIYEGYKDLGVNPPQIHIVQTSRICPISKEFDKKYKSSTKSLALAISDRVSHRKPQIITLIKETGGFGWVISDEELEKAINLKINKNGSPNSNLSLAGFLKARKTGWKFKNPCLIFSGL